MPFDAIEVIIAKGQAEDEFWSGIILLLIKSIYS